jgi:hypothetical protein
MIGKKTVQRRPAESGAVASAVALLICRLLDVNDVDTVTALAIVIGFVPVMITWIVTTARGRTEAEA